MNTKKLIKELVRVELNPNQFAAIESFVQDRGIEIFKNSNLLKVINRNELHLVAEELGRWVVQNGRHDPQLSELRHAEIELFAK